MVVDVAECILGRTVDLVRVSVILPGRAGTQAETHARFCVLGMHGRRTLHNLWTDLSFLDI